MSRDQCAEHLSMHGSTSRPGSWFWGYEYLRQGMPSVWLIYRWSGPRLHGELW